MAKHLLSILGFILLSAFFVLAQESETLQLSQSIEKQIKGGESHFFTVQAEGNKHLSFNVNQKGVDVVTLVFNSEKKRIAEFDSLNGKIGIEKAAFVAEQAGIYFIEISAGKSEPAGKIEITFDQIRDATPTDRELMAVNDIFWEADKLMQKGTAESRRLALEKLNQSLTIYEKLNYDFGKAYTLHNIALVHRSFGDYNKALEFFTLAVPLWEKFGDKVILSDGIAQIGYTNSNLGNPQIAIEYANKALKLMTEVKHLTGAARVNSFLATLYSRRGENAKAIGMLESAFKIQMELGRKNDAALTLVSIGIIYNSQSETDQAKKYHLQALEIYREINNKDAVGMTTIELGLVSLQKGNAKEAIPIFQEALGICQESGSKVCEARAYNYLSSANKSLGDLQTAIDYSQKAAEIFKISGNKINLGRNLNQIGDLYATLELFERALENYQQALNIFVQIQERSEEGVTLMNLAKLYRRSGDLAQASEYYQKMTDVCRIINNQQCLAVSLNGFGVIEHKRGNYEKAIGLYSEALGINLKTGSKVDESMALLNIGTSYLNWDKYEQAEDYFKQALASFRSIENKSDTAFTLYQLALTNRALGRLDESLKFIEDTISIVEGQRAGLFGSELQTAFFSSVQLYYDLYIELLMQKHRKEPSQGFDFKALQVSEQARARRLLDLLKVSNTNLNSKIDAQLLEKEKEIIKQINVNAARQTQAANNPKQIELAKSLNTEIERLFTEYEAIQGQIKKANPRYAEITQKQQFSLPEIAQLLDSNTVLVEIKLGKNASFLWLVSPDKVESYELPSQTEITKVAEELYKNLTTRNLKTENRAELPSKIKTADLAISSTVQKLYQLIFGKVNRKFTGKTVAIVADGILQNIPFSLLLEENEVITLPSLSVISEIRNRNSKIKPTKTISLFADPIFEANDSRIPPDSSGKNTAKPSNELKSTLRDFNFGENFPRLLSTRLEAKNISSLVPPNQTDVRLDFDANLENILKTELSNFKIIHLATHGLLNDSRPELSGLVFSLYDKEGKIQDGFLRLNQIYNLNLNSDLVVLSACQTALGKDVRGEGLIGLTRGFMYAGAKRIVASLWKVDDAATAEFMKRFYQNLLVKKLKPATALAKTQTEIKQIPRFKSPYFWAGFTIQGDWK